MVTAPRMTQEPQSESQSQHDHERDDERIESRAELLPEELAAGSDDPHEQAEAILEESDERTNEQPPS